MTAFESREFLEKVLTRLAELVQADPAFLEASQGKTLTVSMEFPDWEAFFGSVHETASSCLPTPLLIGHFSAV